MAWYPNQYGQGTPGYSGYVGPLNYGYSASMQQPQMMNPQAQSGGMNTNGLVWVDGEVGAKAYQMPAGMTGPIALWDTNDQVIYLKSCNQMGMPNPLQKIRYQMEEQPQYLPGQSGAENGDYVSKDDFQSLKNEIASLREMLSNQNQNRSQAGNQNGSNQSIQNGGNNGNRGGNR